MRSTASHGNAPALCSFFLYACKIQGDADRNNAVLKLKKQRRSRSSTKVSDILIWGDLVVYTSPEEAIESLSNDCVDEQLVRLLMIADNAQLRLMLEAGVELCSAGASLYLRVDPSCPIYWMRWDPVKTNADLDISCAIPHRGSRETMLNQVATNPDGEGGVRARHARNKPSETSTNKDQRPLLVNTGCGRIVGTESFATRFSTAGNVSEKHNRGDEDGEEEDEEEDEEDEEEEMEG